MVGFCIKFPLKPSRKVFVALLQWVILTAKVTLQTFCTYEQHLRPLFMEWHPCINRSILVCIDHKKCQNNIIHFRTTFLIDGGFVVKRS